MAPFIMWGYAMLLVFPLSAICDTQSRPRLTAGAMFNEEALKYALKWQDNHSSNDSLNVIDLLISLELNNVFKSEEMVCNMTNSETGVIAIFGPQDPIMGAIAQSVCEQLIITYIQTTWQPIAGPIHSVSVNFYPAADLLAEGLATIVQNMNWETYAIVYQHDEALIRLQRVLERTNTANKPVIIRKLRQSPNYRPIFEKLKEAQVTNLILDCEPDDTIDILQQAKAEELLTSSTNYLLTSLNAHTIDFSSLHAKANITMVRLFDPLDENLSKYIRVQNWEMDNAKTPKNIRTEAVLLIEALNLLVRAVSDLDKVDTIEPKPADCDSTDTPHDGELAMYMKMLTERDSFTGSIEFDSYGRRVNFTLQVVELGNEKTKAIWNPVRGIQFLNDEQQYPYINERL